MDFLVLHHLMILLITSIRRSLQESLQFTRKIDISFNRIKESFFRHVDDIDLYLGGISERSVPDGIVGPIFACIIGGQFHDLRRGDRLFYETSHLLIGFPSGIDSLSRWSWGFRILF